jgi:hypothetical protein
MVSETNNRESKMTNAEAKEIISNIENKNGTDKDGNVILDKDGSWRHNYITISFENGIFEKAFRHADGSNVELDPGVSYIEKLEIEGEDEYVIFDWIF